MTILNTCEYCLETFPGLQDKIEEKVDEAFKEKITFDDSSDIFKDLINECVHSLISSIEKKNEAHYTKMLQYDWENLEEI